MKKIDINYKEVAFTTKTLSIQKLIEEVKPVVMGEKWG